MVQEGLSSEQVVDQAVKACCPGEAQSSRAAKLQQLQAALQRIHAKGAEGATPLPDAEVRCVQSLACAET